MTDSPTTPRDTPPIWAGATSTTPDTENAAAEPDAADAPPPRRGGRGWLIALAIAVPVVLALLVCGGIAALASGVQQMGRDADETRHGRERASAACLDLEKRLNRLAPPGAATDATERAAAIRAENAAVRPFLARVEQVRRVPGHDEDAERDGHRGAWQESWGLLLNARTAYAEALERQEVGGQRAFFLAPQTGDGTPALEVLQDGPDSCAGVLRRLTAPDL
ncbi:hypothetical protein SAMN05444365_101304 [Micromonospora pattaloongensis]|uniref:Uncharacterized protein n=1 Tax=Micromonospora pattaloongensis TaxID=405436 RepID=A0A1H3G758_9ACTN|nr:hypothetical protein [Micromonospora pattaloongensis]SDX98885.1 hypothetical protein SAMN05444365_101304 [Micromonospora pattaloongensis]